jgi:metal-responsive CopG/Arc/MetJ family transcriptional regulator
MRTTRVISLSLSPELARTVERVAHFEGRTKSALFREALRTYLASRRIREDVATPAEVRAIRRGRAAYARRDYVTLDQLLHDLGSPRRRTRPKTA